MRILYIGCVKSSYVLLEELLMQNKNIVSIITQDKNNFNSDYRNLKPLAKKFNKEIKYFNNINSLASIEYIKSVSPDVIYCFGWSQLLNKEMLSIPPKGVVGFHPTKLPNNKGRHPIIWTLVLGLKETASTFFLMDSKADNGEIISQNNIKVSSNDFAKDLYEKILVAARMQVIDITDKLEKNNLEIIKANTQGNVWRKRNYLDGIIDFRMSAQSIYNLVRALSKPYIGAEFLFKNKNYKVWNCEIIIDKDNRYNNIEYGKVLSANREFIVVKTGKDLIKIYKSGTYNISEGDYL